MYIFQPDRFLLRKQVASVASYIKGRILDVGAGGHDRYSSFFKYTEYIKMDVSAGENVDVIGSAEQIPFAENYFDAVVCTQVFEHLARPHLCTREVYRVLKKGGYAVVTVPQMNELHEEPHDFFRYTSFGLKQLFTDAGFAVVSCEKRGGFFATLFQMEIRYCIDRFNLYQHPFWGRCFNRVASLGGKISLWLDSKDSSAANQKHAIGWCIVLRK